MGRKKTQFSEILLISILGIPFIGFFMGGIYFVPVEKFCKREPWSLMILALGLAITILIQASSDFGIVACPEKIGPFES